jgi:hypothetical protein
MTTQALTGTVEFTNPIQNRASSDVGGVQGGPKLLLRLEGAAVFLAGLLAWSHEGGSWLHFALLFLVPDLSMLGYLHSPRIGALLYNTGHSYLLPFMLAGLGLLLSHHALLPAAILWGTHIGFDRLMGYGLKYPTRFFDTHLGYAGPRASKAGA